jgi:cytochrome c oxidase cbb3-type subunit 2
MKMTPAALVAGTLVVLFAIIGIVLILPVVTELDTPSDAARRRSAAEERGRLIYIREGCQYCHSQYVRRVDWGPMAERLAQAGDYVFDKPQLFGSERTGPDLSQEGGQHPDDWHEAHFANPRLTRPESVMPPFDFLADEELFDLVDYVQSVGGTDADARIARQQRWHAEALRAWREGPDANVAWLHAHVPAGWRTAPNPYPADGASLARGARIFQSFCLGCHGPVGDGQGPAAPFLRPPPLNFTTLRRAGASGGVLYYQIMNGITGTAMPYFKHELESEKIWDVSNYLLLYFLGGKEAGTDGQAIDAAFEGQAVPTWEPREPTPGAAPAAGVAR